MEALLETPWRTVPSYALILLGGFLIARGIRVWRTADAGKRDPERALLIARGFRIAIVGLTLSAGGIGWLYSIGWVVALAAIIACEEILETTTMILALRSRRDQITRAADSSARA